MLVGVFLFLGHINIYDTIQAILGSANLLKV